MRVNRLSDEPGHDSDGVVSRTAIKLLSRVSPDTLGVNGILQLNRTYIGGVEGTRTLDPLTASQALYQLSYAPEPSSSS